jgi:antitoxin HigA-1
MYLIILIKTNILALHPGKVLHEEFFSPLGLSQNKLAIALRVPARRI